MKAITTALLVLLTACGGGGEECATKKTIYVAPPLIQTEDGRLVRAPGKFVPVEVCADEEQP